MRQNKRRLFLGLSFVAAVPLAIASVAYACQRITPMHGTPDSGPAGSTIQVSGTNFSREATSSDVAIRLDRRDGPVLASISPSQLEPVGSTTGKFTINVTIPANTAIGNHILIGTQTLANGAPCVGCPGRANFEVTAAGARTASNETAAGPAAAREERSDASAASEPTGYSSEPATQPVPAEATASPAAAPAPAAPAAATPAPAAPVPAPATASEVPAPVSEASPVVEAPVVVSEPAPAPAPAAGIGLVPAAAPQTTSPLPRFAFAAGLALVLMGLIALWKSGRTALGGRRLSPVA